MPTKRKPIERHARLLMPAAARKWLRAMFASDIAAADYFERFPPYEEVTLRVPGIKPWYPPLSLVWQEGPEPVDWWRAPEAWKAAYELVERLRGG